MHGHTFLKGLGKYSNEEWAKEQSIQWHGMNIMTLL